jgi:hypothetical protein
VTAPRLSKMTIVTVAHGEAAVRFSVPVTLAPGEKLSLSLA